MSACKCSPRIFIGDKSIFYAWTDNEDPAMSNFQTMIDYLSFSETKIILTPKEYNEIASSLKGKKLAWFENFFMPGEGIGVGNTSVEEDINSLMNYYSLYPGAIYIVSKNWILCEDERFCNKYSQGFLDQIEKHPSVGKMNIDEMVKYVNREEPEFYGYMHQRYYSGTY